MKEQIETINSNIHDITQIKKKDWYKSYSVTGNYTFNDNDQIKTLFVTTGAGNITVTLPTVADNPDRVIEVIKVDSGAGYIIVDGEGAETINNKTTIRLISQYDRLTIKSTASEWIVIESRITYDTGWINNSDWTDADLTATHNMNTHMENLIIIFMVSSASDGSTAVRMETLCGVNLAASSGQQGSNIFYVSDNTIKLQTGANGFTLVQDAAGAIQGIDTENWYYKFKIKRIL